MNNKKFPISRKDNIVVQDMDGEVLIYDLNNNKAFCLNETSALVWEMCDGNKSINEIGKQVSKKLNLEVNDGLIWLALDKLTKEKLVDSETLPPIEFEGLSRRQVIKKIGFASLVALPVITSLTAPTAVSAQTCAPPLVAPGGMTTVTGAASSGTCFAALPANCCSNMVSFPSRMITAGPPAPFSCEAICA